MRVVIYEPTITGKFQGWEVISDFDEFVSMCDKILANRMDSALKPVEDKVYCRDLFSRD
jgi:UDPglucose 6-dehydrogenase